MNEHAFVVCRAQRKRIALDHAKVGQHLAHVRRFHRRQRQIMRPRGEALRAERTARGIAIALRSLDDNHVAPAAFCQPPRAA